MQAKASLPALHLNGNINSPFITAYFEFNHLKNLYRQGWLQRGVSPDCCESVAEHCFGVALLALLMAEAYLPELDLLKIVRMALIHDLGEIYVGDITPTDGIEPAVKYAQEHRAIEQVLGKLPHGEQYVALWEEYERQESAEARFIHQVDQLEMALQASVYEHQTLASLTEFFHYVETQLTEPELQAILKELETLRTTHPLMSACLAV